MGFIEVAQGWLREQAERDVEPVLPPEFDVAHCRTVMWEALRRLSGDAQQEAHRRWSAEGYLERFVTEVVVGLRSGIGAVKKPSTFAWLTDAAIRAAVRGTEVTEREAGGALEKFDLNRVIFAAKTRTAEVARFAVDIPKWCRAVSMVGEDGTPSATGRAFLSLVGREAVLFALELEVALSTGFTDALRVSYATLEELAGASLTIEQGERLVDNRIFYDDVGDHPWPPHSRTCLKRLVDLGIVEEESEDRGFGDLYSISIVGRDLVHTVLDPAPNPYRALVHALLDAERGRVSAAATGQPAAASTDLAYVQMVVHELRNINYPLNNAVRRLWTELDRPGGPDPAKVAEYRQRIDTALERVNTFASDSAKLATAAASESFGLQDVVREAVSTTEAERNGRIAVFADALPDAQIEGARARWVLLFVNLLRNSAQVRAGRGSVWLSGAPVTEGRLDLYIDDDGPGVPEEYRERVFERGHSTRGGTGLGLHDVRATVRLSGGTIVCTVSPRGGARFHIQVPARRSA